eukprot:g4205.t1
MRGRSTIVTTQYRDSGAVQVARRRHRVRPRAAAAGAKAAGVAARRADVPESRVVWLSELKGELLALHGGGGAGAGAGAGVSDSAGEGVNVEQFLDGITIAGDARRAGEIATEFVGAWAQRTKLRQQQAELDRWIAEWGAGDEPEAELRRRRRRRTGFEESCGDPPLFASAAAVEGGVGGSERLTPNQAAAKGVADRYRPASRKVQAPDAFGCVATAFAVDAERMARRENGSRQQLSHSLEYTKEYHVDDENHKLTVSLLRRPLAKANHYPSTKTQAGGAMANVEGAHPTAAPAAAAAAAGPSTEPVTLLVVQLPAEQWHGFKKAWADTCSFLGPVMVARGVVRWIRPAMGEGAGVKRKRSGDKGKGKGKRSR